MPRRSDAIRGRQPGRHNSVGSGYQKNVAELNREYLCGDEMVNVCIDRLPDDCTRRGVIVTLSEEEKQTAIQNRLDQLQVVQKLNELHTWARLQGGCPALIVTNDNLPLSAPVDESSTDIKAIHVLSRDQLQVHSLYESIVSPLYRTPEFFRWAGNSSDFPEDSDPAMRMLVHSSRVIVFPGLRRPPGGGEDRRERVWGISLLDRVGLAIRRLENSEAAIDTANRESQYRLLKLRNLHEMISRGHIDARSELIQKFRDEINCNVVDVEEDFQVQSADFKAVIDANMVAQQKLAAVNRTSVTLLFGQSPAGFSTSDTTGERNYWASVSTTQEKLYKPAIERIVTILARGLKIQDSDWSISFPPLMEPTDKELSEIRRNIAETDSAYISHRVITRQEARQRFTGQDYKMDIRVPEVAAGDEEPEFDFSEVMAEAEEVQNAAGLVTEGDREEPAARPTNSE